MLCYIGYNFICTKFKKYRLLWSFSKLKIICLLGRFISAILHKTVPVYSTDQFIFNFFSQRYGQDCRTKINHQKSITFCLMLDYFQNLLHNERVTSYSNLYHYCLVTVRPTVKESLSSNFASCKSD